MPKQSTVLIVDDDKDILTAGKLLLKRQFGEVVSCDRPSELPQLISAQHFDAILLDMNFSPGDSSGAEGIYWLKEILKLDPDAVVVVVTAHAGLTLAVEAMKHGATDFIAKPWQNEKVVATVSAAIALRKSRSEASSLRRSNEALASASISSQAMLGTSKAMQQVQSLIARSAPTDANVLILGENGTGKELAARAVHAQSERSAQVFMAIDLGAISETLFETELFGHVKGAFSGADQHREGRLLAANKGTLFLDEIGNLPLALQTKLLSVLEQREVTPVGSNTPRPLDVRVIAATNMPRTLLYGNDSFREDLLFRLNTVEIDLPPLRDRLSDIEHIAQHYAQYFAKKYRKAPLPLSAHALAVAGEYNWPGNVRELKHSIERAVILAEGAAIEAEDLQLLPKQILGAHSSESMQKESTLVIPIAQETATAGDLNLENIERKAITEALKRHGYNISHTAKELGLTRAALYRRMEKHGL